MTHRAPATPTSDRPAEEETQLYRIDPAWHQEHSFSLAGALKARRCPSCQASPQTPEGSKRKGGAKAQRAPQQEAWLIEMQGIGECCSQKPGYITSSTPAVEAAFRVLLAGGNHSCSLQELAAGVRKGWAGGDNPRDIQTAVLERLLERDAFYGIRRAPAETPPQKAV